MSSSGPSRRSHAAVALRRAGAALARSLTRALAPRRPRAGWALVALALALGACAEAPGVTAPAAPPSPSGPSRLVVSAPGRYIQANVGFLHTCAVSAIDAVPARAVTCWGGTNDYGQTTVPLMAQSGIAHVSAGGRHTCAVTANEARELACWGSNEQGQTTVPSGFERGIAAVSTGVLHTCAVSTTGALACWGNDTHGEASVPSDFASGILDVSTGDAHTCAVSTAGALRCWGSNADGQAAVPSGYESRISQVSAGGSHTCAVRYGGDLHCWGDNSQGQTTVPSGAASNVFQVSTGFLHTCAVSYSGALTCWGWTSTFGQATVPSTAATGIQFVSAGGYHTCAISYAGGVTCWGDNRFGQTTVPTTTTRVLPTATFGAPTAPVVPGQSFTLTLTNAQVPGHTSTFTYAFDCGTGTYTTPSTTGSQSCPTSAAGVLLAVRGKVIDRDGDFAEYSASVSVTAPPPVLTPTQRIGALRVLVGASTLAPDLRRALTAKLDAALKAVTAGKTKAACSALADFASQVRAQRGKAISTETADAWLAETATIRTAAGC